MASLVLLLSVLVRPHNINNLEEELSRSINSASRAAANTVSAARKQRVEQIMVLEEDEHLSDCSRVSVDSVWP
ncbi:hypothetical protein RchiOBHm_Chr3g0496471 [Rosa chinensis]|uniref:Uncharacterized protein n=1 Tax=Rosa chinensis TaxID=74649 RepID=A0A2P6RHH3_ROSCH|nr:hypothetical protein RchiOBHm_Chr3g0496471 [Rosa chinensis]